VNLFDAYDILGCHPAMSDLEIKSRHRILSQMYHPDRDGGDSEKFMAIQESYRAVRGLEARKLLATRLQGLGDPCISCSGRGWVKTGPGFTTKVKVSCRECRGCGYIPR
jgi:DnaJ-class molecular chaperone